MRAKPYPRYKPSGIEWLGEVPAHWEVKRLKGAATCWVSNVDKVAAEDELPVRLCNYTDVYYHDHIKPSMGLMETTATPEEIRRFGLVVADVVITKDSEEWSDIAVPALVVESSPDLVCGYHLAIVRPRAAVLEGSYLLRAFQARAVNQQFQVAATGVTRYGLPKSSIGDAWIPLPSLTEQRAIAEFLEGETAKLDMLVAKKRTLVERLKEKRTALISRTVTRGLPPDAARAAGLDPHPKLKPSGIDWLGDVPEDWEVKPLGRLVRFVGGATPDKGKPEYWDGDIPWVSPKDMKRMHISDVPDHVSPEALSNSPLTLLPERSVLIVVRGMILAHSFPVAITDVPATINQDMKAITTGRQLNADYLLWSLTGIARVFVSLSDESAHGTRKLESEIVSRVCLTLPSLMEQEAIVAFLTRETAKIGAMVQKVEAAIERLQEYRTALITAAVTGEVDVRGGINGD